MKLIILTICCISIFVFFYKKKEKHMFWDKQPVSRNNLSREGKIIKNNLTNNLNLESSFNIISKKIDEKSQDIFDFINTNFNDNYQYSHDFLHNSLTYIKNSIVNNLVMYKEDEIIGFIHGKPITIVINNSIINAIYVDYLCVKKQFRKNNLATILISSLINNNCNKIFIFKKENKSLPFNYINETNYYYLNIKNINIKSLDINNKFCSLTEKNLLDVYNFIKNISCKKKLYQKLSQDEFKDIYMNNNTRQIIVEYNNNTIKAVLFYNIINFVDNNNILKTADIEYIFSEEGANRTDIMEFMISKCKNENIDIISLVNQLNNNYFIKKYNFIKSMKLYIHMYNYHLNNTINSDEICFNIL